MLASFGQVHAPFGLHVQLEDMLGALDPVIVSEAKRLVDLVLSFRATTIQAVAVLPVIR